MWAIEEPYILIRYKKNRSVSFRDTIVSFWDNKIYLSINILSTYRINLGAYFPSSISTKPLRRIDLLNYRILYRGDYGMLLVSIIQLFHNIVQAILLLILAILFFGTNFGRLNTDSLKSVIDKKDFWFESQIKNFG